MQSYVGHSVSLDHLNLAGVVPSCCILFGWVKFIAF